MNNKASSSEHEDTNKISRMLDKKTKMQPCSPPDGDSCSPSVIPESGDGSYHSVACRVFADVIVQKAYEKMLRLDEKLARLSAREKEVKKQNRLLDERIESLTLAMSAHLARDGEGWCLFE